MAARAREAPDAENDLRGIGARGKRWSDDRSRRASTLLNTERFGDRLEAARRWHAGQDEEHADPDPRRRLTPEQIAAGKAALARRRAASSEGT